MTKADCLTSRSLPSIKRPSVPDRGGADGEGYLEPAKNGKAEYVNPAYDNDSSKDYHTYHVLQKDGQGEFFCIFKLTVFTQ